jgi:hypothetical protein
LAGVFGPIDGGCPIAFPKDRMIMRLSALRLAAPLLLLAALAACTQVPASDGPSDAEGVRASIAEGAAPILPGAEDVATTRLPDAAPSPTLARPAQSGSGGPVMWSAEQAVRPVPQAPAPPKSAPVKPPEPTFAAEPATIAAEASPVTDPPAEATVPARKPGLFGGLFVRKAAPEAAPEGVPDPTLRAATLDDVPTAPTDPAARTETAAAEPVVEKAPTAEELLSQTPEVPEAQKTALQRTCEKQGGVFAATGQGNARSCVKRTRDAGKACRRESDCDGVCLARSRSCAPLKPLFGCNEILQNDGRQVRLCID